MNYVGDYQLYLGSGHWQQFVKKHIIWNKKAKCWICGSKRYLQGHHGDYDHLYEEKLNKHVFILDRDCHRKVHFLFWLIKLPLKPWLLKLRMYQLRFCLKVLHVPKYMCQ